MNRVALLIGGNQGDRRALIEEATALIQQRIGTVASASSIYETEPWGEFEEGEVQPFLNQALLVETPLTAHEVLQEALGIEKELGRVRNNSSLSGNPQSLRDSSPILGEHPDGETRGSGSSPKIGEVPEGRRGTKQKETATSTRIYHSRPIDIDLIFYNNEVIDTPDLIIPHPRAHLRSFVLEPLAEIMPDYRHPIIGKKIIELRFSTLKD